MSEANGEELPKGWERVSLSSIAKINPPLGREIDDETTNVNFVPMRAVEAEGGGLLRPETRQYGQVKKGFTAFLSGDVIMAKITPCMENGKTTVVPELPGQICFGSTEFHVLRPEKDVQARWVANYLLQHSMRQEAQRKMAGGVGQMRVPVSFLDSLPLPLAPAAEQRRIAETLDELLSDLDAGIAALERAQTKLSHYRAAVLKAAVEGTLTAEWRRQNPTTEPASELLKHILVERRRKWEEEQLRKYQEAGKQPPANWKERYEQPVDFDKVDLRMIPSSWITTSMDSLTSRITSGSRDWKQYYGYGSGTFVMAQNVRPGKLDLRVRQIVNPPAEDSSCGRSLIKQDDLLITIVGANTGDVCRVPESLDEHYVCQSVTLMRPVEPSTAKYLEYYCNSPSGALLHYRRYIYGAGRPHLSFDQLKMTPILLPPIAEQHVIVEAVEGQLSVIDHLETDLEAKLKSASALRQAILKHAFSGKLVPQDPNDEPASELLKRIAAMRAAEQRSGPRARRGARNG
jgi:type I restriction enzyme S subunit